MLYPAGFIGAQGVLDRGGGLDHLETLVRWRISPATRVRMLKGQACCTRGNLMFGPAVAAAAHLALGGDHIHLNGRNDELRLSQ